MTEGTWKEQEIIQALADSGMNENSIHLFMDSISSHHLAAGKQLLNEHRAALLENIHQKQNELYCMDYLMRELEKVLSW